jgi:alkylhydroperoxidase family enzyme
MQAGVGEEKIRQVPTWRESPHFSDLERTALEYAERMTITGETVGDGLWSRVRTHFSEAQMVELTAAVALENFRSKFNVALGVEAQGFCMIDGPRDPGTSPLGPPYRPMRRNVHE